MYSSDKETLLNYYKTNFATPISKGFNPDIEKWFGKVEEKHQKLREKLGGISKTYERDIKLDFSEVKTADWNLVSAYAYNLYNLIPAYFKEYNYTEYMMTFVVIPEGKFAERKWTKHIAQWMNNKKDQITEETRKEVEKQLSALGDIYSKATCVQEFPIYLHITTNPIAFLELGATSVDMNTCFNHHRTNAIHKFIIAQTADTYVGYISESPEIDNIDKRYCRFWGAVDDTVAFATNFYRARKYAKEYEKTDIPGILNHCLSHLLSVEKLHLYKERLEISGAWQNPHSFLFSKEELKEDEIIGFEADEKDLENFRKCFNCSAMTSDLIVADHNWQYCKVCSRNFSKCEYSGKYTSSCLYAGYIDKYKTQQVCQDILRKKFALCEATARFYLKSLILTNGKNQRMNVFTAQEGGWSECPQCGEWINKIRSCTCRQKSQEDKKESIEIA